MTSKEAMAVRRRLVLHFGETGSLDLHLQRPGDRALARVQPIDDSFLRADAHAPAPQLHALEPLPAFDDDAMVDFFVQGHIGRLLGDGGDGLNSVRVLPPPAAARRLHLDPPRPWACPHIGAEQGLATPTGSSPSSTYSDVLQSMSRRRPDAPQATTTPLRVQHLEGLEQHLRDVLGSPKELQQPQQAGAEVEAVARGGRAPDDSAFDGAGEDALLEEDRGAAAGGDEQQPEAPTGSAFDGGAAEGVTPTSKLAALAEAANEEERRVEDRREQWAMEEKLGWTGGPAMSVASVARLHRQLTDDGVTTLSDEAIRAMQRRVGRTLRRSRRPRRRQALTQPIVALDAPPIRGMASELWAPHRDVHLLPGLGGSSSAQVEEEEEANRAVDDAGADHDAADDAFDGAGEGAIGDDAPVGGVGGDRELRGDRSPAPSLPPTAVDDDIEALRAAGSTPSRQRQRGSLAPRSSRSGTRPSSPRSLGVPTSRPHAPHSAHEPVPPQTGAAVPSTPLRSSPEAGVGGVDAGEIRVADGSPSSPSSRRWHGSGRAAVAVLRPQSLCFIKYMPSSPFRLFHGSNACSPGPSPLPHCTSALQSVREGEDAARSNMASGESSLDTTLPELVRPARRRRHRKFAAWMFLQTLGAFPPATSGLRVLTQSLVPSRTNVLRGHSGHSAVALRADSNYGGATLSRSCPPCRHPRRSSRGLLGACTTAQTPSPGVPSTYSATRWGPRVLPAPAWSQLHDVGST